ncbi:hypothetical protein AAE478_005981 [Parahypoxylon ruwenzoriense]
MAAQPDDDEVRLCTFCASINWTQLTTGPFNPSQYPLRNGHLKTGEHNPALICSAASSSSCNLCSLVAQASQTLKPWWPIAHLLSKNRVEGATCAFYSTRNRLGSGGGGYWAPGADAGAAR